VIWQLERTMRDQPLLLDTSNLDILSVRTGNVRIPSDGPPRSLLDANDLSLMPTRFELGKDVPVLGAPLWIDLPAHVNVVEIYYRTTAQSAGLQWLSPAQTDDRRSPFLYTQGQSIMARSYLPCQDTPNVRFTYDARIHVPAPLRAVMAARAIEPSGPTRPVDAASPVSTFNFAMELPIPAYLVGLAVGELDFAPISPRVGIWASPTVLPKAAMEMGDLESMMQAAERLFGPYLWGRYDVLILPPSFPLGGMENPMVTFLTPTLLAGDRSLVSVVAHELAHSWSGNLTTNATWSDFWLNEGLTTYAERRIIEAIYGLPRAAMERALGRQTLEAELHSLAGEPQRQILAAGPNFALDPLDEISDVPYEKGALFLEALEHCVGRENFDVFFKQWINEHGFQSVTSRQFENAVETHLKGGESDKLRACGIDVGQWLHGPGIPESAPKATSLELQKIDLQSKNFSSGQTPAEGLETSDWNALSWLRFLKQMPDAIGSTKLAELDAKFNFSGQTNAEILGRWLELAALNHYSPGMQRIPDFLTTIGRRKLVEPIYRALAQSPADLATARSIFAQAGAGYHSLTRNTIESILRQAEVKYGQR
jgi:aminopeptidase N